MTTMKRIRYHRYGGRAGRRERTPRLPVARTVPLGEAIAALTELERNRTPKGGKLIITIE